MNAQDDKPHSPSVPAVYSSVWTTFSDSLAKTITMGRALAPCLQAGDVVLLSGDLGAGKTQITKGIAQGLGCDDIVVSPTFNIMLTYDGGRLPLYHFDLYRLEKVSELYDVDYFGVLEDDGVSVVEWGDKFPEALPQDYLEVRLTVDYDSPRHMDAPEPLRCIELRGWGPRSTKLAQTFVEQDGADVWNELE